MCEVQLDNKMWAENLTRRLERYLAAQITEQTQPMPAIQLPPIIVLSCQIVSGLVQMGRQTKVSRILIKKVHSDFNDVFTGLFDSPTKKGCLCTTRATERRARQAAKATKIIPLDVGETSGWCNSFMLFLKTNGNVRLCLDLTRSNTVLIRPIHRG